MSSHWPHGSCWIICAVGLIVGLSGATTALAQAASAQAAPAAETAATRVDDFHAMLREAAALQSCRGREALIAESVGHFFDIPGIARRLLRREWSALDTDQRLAFARNLQALTASGYSANFDDPARLTFEPTELQRDTGQRVVVRSTLPRTAQASLRFDYLLEIVDGDWRITNVSVEGVSEMTLRAAQYGRLARESGIDALLARMDEQIRETRRGCLGDGEEAQ